MDTPIVKSPGIDRFLWTILTFVLSLVVFWIQNWNSSYPRIDSNHMIVLGIVAYILLTAQLCLNWLRLNHLGFNSQWSIITLIPILNLGLELVCFVCPVNFKEQRRLDTIGKALVISAICAALFLSVSLLDGLFSMGHWRPSSNPLVVASDNCLNFVSGHFALICVVPFSFGVFSLIGDVILIILTVMLFHNFHKVTEKTDSQAKPTDPDSDSALKGPR